jgi:uncharacterized protein (TIGR02757 family)
LSWGQRKTIINKANELVKLMDNHPYDFVMNHTENDLKKLLTFKHRTFQPTDTLYFIEFFKTYYSKNESLESAFIDPKESTNIKAGLIQFHNKFFSLEYVPQRTRKHVSTPSRKSACKRLNMFLRWMVRADENGVDFGIWTQIKPEQLMIPLDVHVFRVAKQLGILTRHKADWQAVEELTEHLRILDPYDPVKYDFALFSMGVLESNKK